MHLLVILLLASPFDDIVARPGGLTAEDVAARAVKTSFNLRQSQNEVIAAARAADQALVAYFPRLSGVARYVRLSNVTEPPLGDVVVAPKSALNTPLGADTLLVSTPVVIPVFLNQTTLQATLALPLLDYALRFPALNAAAKRSLQAARLAERARALQIATDARVSYYNWVRARAQTVVAAQALVQAQAHAIRAGHAFEVGQATQADVLQAKAQVSASEQFVAQALRLENTLAAQLRVAMHDREGTVYEIGEDFRQTLPALAAPPTETWVSEACDKRVEVQLVDAQARAADAQANVNRASALPHLDAFGDVLTQDPNQRYFPQRDRFDTTWDAGIALSWTPNDTASGILGAQSAQAKADGLRDQENALRDQVRFEVLQAIEETRESDSSVAASSQGLDSAEAGYRVRSDLYGNGRATSVELTDAETNLTQARLNLATARVGQRVAREHLQHALGRDNHQDTDNRGGAHQGK